MELFKSAYGGNDDDDDGRTGRVHPDVPQSPSGRKTEAYTSSPPRAAARSPQPVKPPTTVTAQPRGSIVPQSRGSLVPQSRVSLVPPARGSIAPQPREPISLQPAGSAMSLQSRRAASINLLGPQTSSILNVAEGGTAKGGVSCTDKVPQRGEAACPYKSPYKSMSSMKLMNDSQRMLV
ncbi:uncharacterized protein LOC106667020 isoform X2 [Cimex lectularius]|uniref:Uncharacterized protein n=1 Tax=Cimex lectularius TaxID=79782 RepID=A0A8I6SCU9_CIMLE|nr:uncharacterized protein LOC106667020 isoform X2 [Cimex lectularius]